MDYSSKRAPRGGGTESDSSDNSDDRMRSNDNSDDPMRTPSRLPRAAQKVKARLPHEGDNCRAQKRRNKSKKARREQAAGKHRKIILSDSDDGTDGTGEASDGDARAPTDFVASAANSENADNAEGAAATEGTPSTAAAADDAMVSATIAAEAEAEAKAEAEKAKAAGSQGAF